MSDEIEKIEVRMCFPIIGHVVHISVRDKEIGSLLYFWYWAFGFRNVVNALSEYAWLLPK